MQLKDFKFALPFKVNYNITLGLKYLFEDDIDFNVYLPTKNKNLQRPFVWTPHQKNQLILSIFKGIPIPPVTILRYRDSNEEVTVKVIDGKQRIGTLLDFYNNNIPFTWEGKDYFLSDLSAEIYNHFMYHDLLANVGYEYYDERVSDDDLIKWFEYINFMGTPQDVDHLNNLKGI